MELSSIKHTQAEKPSVEPMQKSIYKKTLVDKKMNEENSSEVLLWETEEWQSLQSVQN